MPRSEDGADLTRPEVPAELPPHPEAPNAGAHDPGLPDPGPHDTSPAAPGPGDSGPSDPVPPDSPLEGVPSRLHPSVIAVWAFQAAGPAAVGLFLLGQGSLLLFGLVPVVLAWAGGQYWRFRWHLEPDAVVIQRGLLFRSRRVIPRERVQSVDLERSVLRRILGVVQVRVEAIGGQGTEGQLDALSPAMAEELRRILLRRTPVDTLDRTTPVGEAEGEGALPEAEVVSHVSPRGLLAAGLTGGRVGIGAALVGFFFQFAPDAWIEDFVVSRVESVEDPSQLEAWFAGGQFLIFLAVVAIVGGFLFSVAWTVVQHWDFTLSRSVTGLGVERGLLTQHRDTVPFNRIQAVRIEENWLRRRLGLAALRVVVAGRAGADQSGGTDLLLPIGRRGEVWRIAREVVGVGAPEEGAAPEVELHRMPRGARDRRLVRAGIQTAVMGGLGAGVSALWLDLSWWVGGVGVAGLVVVPMVVLALMAFRGLGWAHLDTHMVVREGALTRTTTLVPVAALQELQVTETFFQRRRRLSTLELPVAAAVPQAIDLGRTTALDLQEDLAERVVRGRREGRPGSV
ncbi:MAG: hypothetical protein EA352_11600, partial [Gemmatimonadales bacterium]